MSWYCPLPFKHAFVDSTGISACCNTERYPTSLSDWATNPNLIALQQDFNAGKIPKQCRPCVDQEKNQGRSLRTDAVKDYNGQYFTETDIDFVDYRSSNICNFKCRSCEPAFSHVIDQEIKNNSSLVKFYYKTNSTKTVSVADENQQWILSNIKKIKRLMITGGEPTVIPGVKDIINLAVSQNPDIAILITTNGSFTDEFWYDITPQMPNLHWTLSLDAVGSAAEIIRHGTNWATVKHNARWLARHSYSFNINTVISNLNILQLHPLLKFVNKLQKLSTTNGCVHQFHVIYQPDMLGVDNVSEELKLKAIDHLNLCLNLDVDSNQRNMLMRVLKQIENSKSNELLLTKFNEFNTVLDSIRNQDHTTLYL